MHQLMRRTEPDDAPLLVTFNVVFTRGTVELLLPFAVSLLQSPAVRLRLVANGCAAEETALIRALAGTEERLHAHELPYPRPVEHGVALNHLFEAFPEPHFAFVDSDVIATGDFMGSLLPLSPGRAAAFTAPPVWMTEERLRAPSRVHALNGARHRAPDGTYVGSTHCALYDRAALEPAWRVSPLGFSSHRAGQVPRGLRRWMQARGWRLRWLDTGKVVNLQLLLAGYGLEERAIPELHHVGGFSLRAYDGTRGGLRRAAAIIRSSADGRRLRRLADGAATRLHATGLPRRASKETVSPRRIVLGHLDQLVEAIRAGRAAPPAPSTGSAELDRRVAALVSAVETQYPRGLATVREASPASVDGAGS